ncbi:hypothetical protein [Lawsonibacter celer]|uniref:hypothetical protein n=1 Tax=Lawsonibacter celer TaxID=2986526 RepID=UPI001647AE67|nr:hypothetical protein [Lawsonibacter celer]
MTYKKRNNISEVSFTYVGTDAQFNEFLKMMIHDYLAVDNPYAMKETEAVEIAEEDQKRQQAM